MLESCGGNFHEGSYQGNGFQLIREYFQQRSCKHCCRNYSSDGIELIREEPGLLVVRVACSSCGQPLGIALVGIGSGAKLNSPVLQSQQMRQAVQEREALPYPRDWTKSDAVRLAEQSQISYDDVLDAHEFFSGLGADWLKYIPQKTKRNRRQDKVS